MFRKLKNAAITATFRFLHKPRLSYKPSSLAFAKSLSASASFPIRISTIKPQISIVWIQLNFSRIVLDSFLLPLTDFIIRRCQFRICLSDREIILDHLHIITELTISKNSIAIRLTIIWIQSNCFSVLRNSLFIFLAFIKLISFDEIFIS